MDEELDKIVQEMIANNESDSNIQGVIDSYNSKKKNSSISTSTSTASKLGSEHKNGSLGGKKLNGFPEIDINSVAPGNGIQPLSNNKPVAGKNIETKTFTGLSAEDLKTLKSSATPAPKINKELKSSLDVNKSNLKRKSDLEKELKSVVVTPENQDEISAKTDELASIQKQQQELKKASDARGIEKQNYSKISSLTNKLATGSSQLGVDFAAIPELAYDVFAAPQNAIADVFDLPSFRTDSEEFKKTIGVNNAVKEYYKNEVSQLREEAQKTDLKYQEGVYDSFVNGDYFGGFDQLTNSFTESLPATMSIMVGGAYAKAPQLMAASSMMFGAEKAEKLKDEDPEINNNIRVANALATGFIQGATETLGTGSIGAAAKGLIEREGTKKATTILKDGLVNYYKTALEKNPILTSMSGEGLEEAFQGVAENAVDVATGVKPADYNIYQTAVDDFIGGAFGGAVFGGGLKGLQQITNYQDNNLMKTNTKKVFNLQNELQNPELSPESRNEINKTIDSLIKNNQKLVQKNIDHVESLSPKVKEELIKAIDVTETTKEKANQIKSDPNTSKETKQILLDNLSKEYNTANERKTKILEGSVSEFDVLPLKEQDKLKREALEELTEELNPDGKKNITITNEQITQKANKIYNRVKDISEIKFETIEPVKNAKNGLFEVYAKSDDGVNLGYIGVVKKGDRFEVKESELFNDSYKGKGVGLSMYKAMIEEANKRGIEVYSDSKEFSEEAQKVWEKLEKEGLAVKVGDLKGDPDYISREEFPQFKTILKNEIVVPESNLENIPELDVKVEKGGVFTGKFLNDYDFLAAGSEHSVYKSKDGKTVIKIGEPHGSSETFNKRVEDALAIDKLIGDGSLSVIGTYKSSNGAINPVYKQDFVEGEIATNEQVAYHLENKGFVKVNDNTFVINDNGVIKEISDISDNFIINKDGKITAIDASIREIPITELSPETQQKLNEINTKNTTTEVEPQAEVQKSTNETQELQKVDEAVQDSNITTDGDVRSGVKPVDEVRVAKQEGVVEEPVSKTVEPESSEGKTEIKKGTERPSKKRTLLNRLIEGGNGKEITDSLNDLRNDYNVRNQKEADSFANKFIETVGLPEALRAAKDSLIENNDIKFLVYSEGLNQLKNEIDNESNLDERESLIKEFQSLSDSFDNDVRNSGQGISILNYIYNKDQSLKYSLSKLISDYKANDINGEIPAEVKAEFEKLTDQLKDVEKRIKEAEKRAVKAEEELAIKNIQEDISRKKEISSKDKSGLTEKEQVRKKELRNKFFGRLNDVTSIATMLADSEFREYLGLTFKAVKGDLSNFSKQILKEIGDGAKKHMPNLFKEAEAIFNEVSKKEQPKVTIDENGKIKIPNQLFRDYVEAGETDIDVISQKIKEDISEEYPDVDVRDIRDALTGYGKQINPNKDEITSKINRLKEYGRLLSAYEDVLGGDMPKKTGIKREKPEQKSRELRREVNRLAKELGLESVNLEEQWATAIDKIKSGLKNQIEDLDKQISKGEKRKVERTETRLDPEAEALKSIRDEKKKILDELVGKPELTEEQRISRAENTLEKSIAKLQEEIDTQNIAYKEKPSPLNSAKLENLRNQKKGLVAAKELLREEAGLVEEKRLKTAKTRVKKQISDLEERIANKDFAKKEVKPILADDELNNLRAEKEEIYEHFEKLKYIQELKNRTKARKFLDAALESLGLLRAVKASLDLGLIGIQLRGFTYSELLRSPKELGKKFLKLFGAIGSQKKSEKAMSQLIGHPLYGLAKKLDIGITQPDLRNEVREEMASGNLLRFIWNSPMIATKLLGGKEFTDAKRKSIGDTMIDMFKKQYNKVAKDKLEITEKDKISRSQQWKNINAFEAIERGLSAYGNQLRFEEFVRGVDKLKTEGKDPVNHPEDYEALASYIRTFSGRAKPAGFEMNQKLLNVFFFSFKNAVSVFQQLNPYYMVYELNKSNLKKGKYTPTVASKMATATFLKSVASTAATMAFLTAAYAAYKDDDDEELTIEKDPRSSDFGKLKIGKLRYDPWGGYVPLISLYSRLLTEEVKKSDGSVYEMGEEQFGIKSRFDASTRFLINKESPGFQMFHHYMASTPKLNPDTGEVERVNSFGETLSEDEAFSMYPIFLGSVRNAIKEDPDMVKSFLTALSVTGLGNVQNYSSKSSSKEGKKGKGSGPNPPSPPKPPTGPN